MGNGLMNSSYDYIEKRRKARLKRKKESTKIDPANLPTVERILHAHECEEILILLKYIHEKIFPEDIRKEYPDINKIDFESVFSNFDDYFEYTYADFPEYGNKNARKYYLTKLSTRFRNKPNRIHNTYVNKARVFCISYLSKSADQLKEIFSDIGDRTIVQNLVFEGIDILENIDFDKSKYIEIDAKEKNIFTLKIP